MAGFGWFFKYISNDKLRMWVKFLYCAACAVVIVMVCQEVHWSNSQYIAALFFGYFAKLIWKPAGSPNDYLAVYWLYI